MTNREVLLANNFLLRFIKSDTKKSKARWWLENHTKEELDKWLEKYQKKNNKILYDEVIVDSDGGVILDAKEQPKRSKENLANIEERMVALQELESETTINEKADWNLLTEAEKNIISIYININTRIGYNALSVLFYNMPEFKQPEFTEYDTTN